MAIGEGWVSFLASDHKLFVCTSFALDQILWSAYAIMQPVVSECIFGSVYYLTPSEIIDILSLSGEGWAHSKSNAVVQVYLLAAAYMQLKRFAMQGMWYQKCKEKFKFAIFSFTLVYYFSVLYHTL